MIKFVDDEMKRFIDFLNEKYNIEQDVILYIMPECFRTDVEHWGFYEEESNLIVVPYIEELQDREDKNLQIMAIIAHEYKHFMNEKLGLEQNEEECDEFAYKVIEEFSNGKIKKGENK